MIFSLSSGTALKTDMILSRSSLHELKNTNRNCDLQTGHHAIHTKKKPYIYIIQKSRFLLTKAHLTCSKTK